MSRRPTATDPLSPPRESETAFRKWVIDLAERRGYLVACSYDSRRVNATAKGFPDLVITHPRRHCLIFAELKQDHRYPDANQRRWLTTLQQIAVAVHVWRPVDRQVIEAILSEVP